MPRTAQKVPWLTLALIGVNLVSAFIVLFKPEVLDSFAFQPATPNPLHALTCLFLHVNVIHLLGNLIFLAAVGPVVEFAKGPLKFGLVYLVSGLAGVGGYWVFASVADSQIPLVGASGAISGCVAYCAIRFLRTKVPVFVNIALPVGLLVGIWVALQAVGAIIQIGDVLAADSGFWPHLSGFLAGLIMAAVLKAGTDAKKEFGHTVLDRMNERGPAAVLAAANHHLKAHPKDVAVWWQRIEAEIDLNERKAAADSLAGLYKITEGEEKTKVLQRLAEIGQLSTLDVMERLKQADTLSPTDPDLAEKIYRSVILQPEEPRKPDAILALAELLKDRKPQESQTLAETLVQQYELHPAAETARAKGLLP